MKNRVAQFLLFNECDVVLGNGIATNPSPQSFADSGSERVPFSSRGASVAGWNHAQGSGMEKQSLSRQNTSLIGNESLCFGT